MTSQPLFLAIVLAALLDPCTSSSPSATTDASGLPPTAASVNAYGMTVDANGQVTSVAQTPTTSPSAQGVAPQPAATVYATPPPVLARPSIDAYAPGPATPPTIAPDANGGLGADYTGTGTGTGSTGTGTGSGSTGVGTGSGYTGAGTTPLPSGVPVPGAAGPQTSVPGAASANASRVGTPIPTQTSTPQPRPFPVPRGLVK